MSVPQLEGEKEALDDAFQRGAQRSVRKRRVGSPVLERVVETQSKIPEA
jgi:hypothetical protein